MGQPYLFYAFIALFTLFPKLAAAFGIGLASMSMEPSGWLGVNNKHSWKLPDIAQDLQSWLLLNTEIEKEIALSAPMPLPDISGIKSAIALNIHFYPLSSPPPTRLYLTTSSETEDIEIMDKPDGVPVTNHGSSIGLDIDQNTPGEFYLYWRQLDTVHIDIFLQTSPASGHCQVTVEVPASEAAESITHFFSQTEDAENWSSGTYLANAHADELNLAEKEKSRKYQQACIDRMLDHFFGDYVWVGPPEEYWKAQWLSGETRLATTVCVNHWDPCGPRQTGPGRVHLENWMIVMRNPVPGINEMTKRTKRTKKPAKPPTRLVINTPIPSRQADSGQSNSDPHQQDENKPETPPQLPFKHRVMKKIKEQQQTLAKWRFEPLPADSNLPDILVELVNVLITHLNAAPEDELYKCNYVEKHSPDLFKLVVAAVHYYLSQENEADLDLDSKSDNASGACHSSTQSQLIQFIEQQQLQCLTNGDNIEQIKQYAALTIPVIPPSNGEIDPNLFNSNWVRARTILKAWAETHVTSLHYEFTNELARFALRFFLAPAPDDETEPRGNNEIQKQFVSFLNEFSSTVPWRMLLGWQEEPKQELTEPEPVEANPINSEHSSQTQSNSVSPVLDAPMEQPAVTDSTNVPVSSLAPLPPLHPLTRVKSPTRTPLNTPTTNTPPAMRPFNRMPPVNQDRAHMSLPVKKEENPRNGLIVMPPTQPPATATSSTSFQPQASQQHPQVGMSTVSRSPQLLACAPTLNNKRSISFLLNAQSTTPIYSSASKRMTLQHQERVPMAQLESYCAGIPPIMSQTPRMPPPPYAENSPGIRNPSAGTGFIPAPFMRQPPWVQSLKSLFFQSLTEVQAKNPNHSRNWLIKNPGLWFAEFSLLTLQKLTAEETLQKFNEMHNRYLRIINQTCL